jgi:ABC-type transport system substrate-binding protein
VLIQEQLRKIGVQMNIEPMEMAALVQHEDARDFDAVMLALHLDASPGGLKQSWGVAEASNPHGTNYGSYTSARFDAQVDSALTVSSPDKAKAAFAAAYRTIIDDAPAVWLYDLKGAIGVNKRIQVAPLRPDAWWAHLADWSIPADQRIARDKVPPQGQ